MKRDTVNYALVGTVVALGLILLLVGLALITGRSGASSDYHTHYANVTGLRYGAPVFYQGYRIGEVTDVEPERSTSSTRYRVTLALRKDWPIPSDSVAVLQSNGLLADVSIGIREGKSSTMLAADTEIIGSEGGDIFAAMNELAGELTRLTHDELTPLVHNLSVRVDSITASLDKDVPGILGDTRLLLGRLNHASDALNDVLKPENRAAIGTILGEVKNLGHELRGTREKLDQTISEVGAIAKENRPDLRHAVSDLSSILETLSGRIDTITHHLDSASRNLDDFSREIRQNPNRLIRTPKADAVEGGTP
ncbi:MAG: MlaD family protein [Dokdonella sp.]